jgi:hypothetical protein
VKTTEAFNPIAGTWSTKANLLTERHGTQAIVSGAGIHVTAGSNTQGGGGKMKNMEFFGTDNPFGTPLTASQLQTPASVDINANSTASVTATCTGGNTGIIITNVVITGQDAAMFFLDTPVDFTLLAPGASLNLTVGFSGTEGGKTAALEIDYGNASTVTITLNSAVMAPGTVLYRVNAGGPLTATNDADPTDWSADQAVTAANGTAAPGTPSPYYNVTPPAVDITFGANFTGTNNTGYPNALFSTERYSTALNPNNMQWNFPVANGDYTVNLLFAEIWTGAQTPGIRFFDVLVEGNLVRDNFDQTAAYGWNTAGVESIPVTVTDGNLDIDFLFGVQNPSIKAIEIISGATLPANDPPVVTNPGGQFGVEGDNVTLQIDATDADPCTGLTYSATGLPPSLTIDPNSGLITGTLDVGTGGGPGGAFIESGGLVIMEAETDFVEAPGGWNLATGTPTYLVGSTNSFGNATGGQQLTYDVQISTPGVYRFHMKSAFGGTVSTDQNDSWFKIDNTADVHFFCVQGGALTSTQEFLNELANPANTNKTLYYPAGNALGRPNHGNENPGNKGYFKVYRSGGGGNAWNTNTIDNNGFPIYAYFPAAGTYTLTMSERSAGHQVDRLALVNLSTSTGVPTGTLNGAQSAQSVGGTVGAAAGSPYNVVVTVTDGCTPALSTPVAFNWNVAAEQTTANLTLTVTSQGRGANHSGVHTVEVYDLNDLVNPAYSFTPTANASGEMTVSGIDPGTYKVLVKRVGFLQRVQELTLATGAESADFGEMRAGNLNADNVVNILDFSLLASVFGQAGQSSDFNGDGVTNILDFSLLASNFGQSGDPLTNN